MFYNWSIGKAATATPVHRLIDSRVFTEDTRVAVLWPEFARHGKDAITVRQVLDHSAGVPGLPAGATLAAFGSDPGRWPPTSRPARRSPPGHWPGCTRAGSARSTERGSSRRSGSRRRPSSGPDQVYGNESRWGLGFGLGLSWDDAGSPRVFGMAGAGGSWAGADPDRGLAVAVTKNVLSMDFVAVQRIVGAILAAVR